MSSEENKVKIKKIIFVLISLVLLLLVGLFIYNIVNKEPKAPIESNEGVTIKTKEKEVKGKSQTKEDIVIDKKENNNFYITYENDKSIEDTINKYLASENLKFPIKDFITNNNFKINANIQSNNEINDVKVKVYDIVKSYKEPQTIIQNDETYEVYTDESIDIYNLDKGLVSYVPLLIFEDEIIEKKFREEVSLSLESESENKKVFSKTYKNDFNFFIGEGHQRLGVSNSNNVTLPTYLKGKYIYFGQTYELYVNGEKVELNVFESENEKAKTIYTKDETVNSFAFLNKMTDLINVPNGDINSHKMLREIVY